MNPKVDAYTAKQKKWRNVIEKLRKILLASGLSEDFKWTQPCYSHQNNNIAIIQCFNPHCALMFFKGSLMKDPKKVMRAPGANSQAARRFEFTSAKEVDKLAATIRRYIKEAIRIEEAGLKVEFKKQPTSIPEELKDAFKKKPALKKAFDALTPGRQRAYLLHFSGAKQSSTRAARVKKWAPQILKGKGMGER